MSKATSKTDLPQLITVRFYRGSGKYYTEGWALTSETWINDAMQQDIVDTQTALKDGWQQQGYYVVSSCDDPAFEGFVDHLWLPGSFSEITKRGDTWPVDPRALIQILGRQQ